MQQGNDKNNDSGDMGLIVMIVGLILFFSWVIWSNFHAQIVYFTAASRYYMLAPLSVFSDNVAALNKNIANSDFTTIKPGQWLNMLYVTGSYLRWIFAPLVLYFAWMVYSRAYTTKFSKRHTMKTLVNQEKAIWPEISPVANLDLVSLDPEKGIWASPMSEREFARINKLLDKKTGALLHDKAEAVFAEQLGRRWVSVNALMPHERAMFALFAAKIGGDKSAITYARRMASSFIGTETSVDLSKMDYSWVDEAIQKHGNHPLVQKCIARHAWVYTVLCTMLQISRVEGVFSSPLWVWLRPVDRRLYIALNCVGRYADFAEAGGICAQWQVEKRFGFPVGFPDVKSAVKGLESALNNFCDDDSLERIFE